MENFGLFIVGYNVMVIGLYLFYTYCNFLLSKKLDVKYPWMAFIPVLNLVNLLYLGGKNLKWGLSLYVLPILILLIFSLIFGVFSSEKGNDRIYFYILSFISIVWIYASIILFHGISKKTGHGKWWTLGLFFASWLFFPVTAFHYEKGDEITPRPFMGLKKFFLISSIFMPIIIPIVIFIGFIADIMDIGFSMDKNLYTDIPSISQSRETSYQSNDVFSNQAELSRNKLRSTQLQIITMALINYFASNGYHPTMPKSGCIPIDKIRLYIDSNIIDPSRILTSGCDGSDGQTYAYRTGIDANGKSYIVIGAKMENISSGNEDVFQGNSDQPIDLITPETSLLMGSGSIYYIVI